MIIQKKSTLAMFVHFKGAYDIVWRSKLVSKLKLNGVRGDMMLCWADIFLAQRWVKIQRDGVEPEYKQPKVGVPLKSYY